MRVGAGTFTADGIDALHEFGTQFVEDLVDQGHAVVFAHSRPQFLVEDIIGCVHHGAGGVEQRDLVLGFDTAGLQHQLLAVHHVDALPLQGKKDDRLNHVHADRLVLETPQLQFRLDFLGHVFGQVGRGGSGAPQGGNAGPRPFAQPGTIKLVVTGGGTKVPQDGFVVLRQQAVPHQLVQGPGTDNSGREVPDVVHVEGKNGPHLRLLEKAFDTVQPLGAQAFKIYPLLPVNVHGAEAFDLCHGVPLSS